MIKDLLNDLELSYSCKDFYIKRIIETKGNTSVENTLVGMINVNKIHTNNIKKEILKLLNIDEQTMSDLIKIYTE
jgi:hypothetical protein